MKHDEIIRALEYCSRQKYTSMCEECEVQMGCRDTLIKEALTLIKAQDDKIFELMKTLKDIYKRLRELECLAEMTEDDDDR